MTGHSHSYTPSTIQVSHPYDARASNFLLLRPQGNAGEMGASGKAATQQVTTAHIRHCPFLVPRPGMCMHVKNVKWWSIVTSMKLETEKKKKSCLYSLACPSPPSIKLLIQISDWSFHLSPFASAACPSVASHSLVPLHSGVKLKPNKKKGKIHKRTLK